MLQALLFPVHKHSSNSANLSRCQAGGGICVVLF
jgi:hypothetical protein